MHTGVLSSSFTPSWKRKAKQKEVFIFFQLPSNIEISSENLACEFALINASLAKIDTYRQKFMYARREKKASENKHY